LSHLEPIRGYYDEQVYEPEDKRKTVFPKLGWLKIATLLLVLFMCMGCIFYWNLVDDLLPDMMLYGSLDPTLPINIFLPQGTKNNANWLFNIIHFFDEEKGSLVKSKYGKVDDIFLICVVGLISCKMFMRQREA
jgi:hypothetical protein